MICEGTSDVALCYGRSNSIVSGYVDADYAGDFDKSKSTIRYVYKIAKRAMSWLSKLQPVMVTSTTRSEYFTATQASKEAVLLKMILEEL